MFCRRVIAGLKKRTDEHHVRFVRFGFQDTLKVCTLLPDLGYGVFDSSVRVRFIAMFHCKEKSSMLLHNQCCDIFHIIVAMCNNLVRDRTGCVIRNGHSKKKILRGWGNFALLWFIFWVNDSNKKKRFFLESQTFFRSLHPKNSYCPMLVEWPHAGWQRLL